MSKQPIDLGWHFNTEDLKRHGFENVDEYMAQRGYVPADNDNETHEGEGGALAALGGIVVLLLLLI